MRRIYAKPLRVAVGVGMCSTAKAEDVSESVKLAMRAVGLDPRRADAIALPSIRGGHPSVEILRAEFADVTFFDVDKARAAGGGSVCEGLAKLAAGGPCRLILRKASFRPHVTVAVAEGAPWE